MCAFVCYFVDSYSPDNAYCYPYFNDWMSSVEQGHGSDSDLFFGDGPKRLSKKSKRISGSKIRLQSEHGSLCTSTSRQCVECNDEESTVKVKPRTSPKSFKPQAAPRKFCMSPPPVRDVSPTKSCDQQRYVPMCVCVCMYVCMYVCTYVRMYVCMYVYACMCVHMFK